MGLEAVVYISDFITSNPDQGDLRQQGDDHLRNIKEGLINTFPNITGPVLASPTELNLLVGLTSLPEVSVETITLTFGTALAAGANRTFTEAKAGILTTDLLLPLPGQPWSTFPALGIAAWRPLTDQIEVVVINSGPNEIPISTSLALPFAVLN